jgi:hypothetical protein
MQIERGALELRGMRASLTHYGSAKSAEISGHLGFCERPVGIQSSEIREIFDRKTGIFAHA